MSLTALGNEHIAKTLYRNDRIHTATPFAPALTPSQIETYRRQGFLAIDGVFSPDEVAEGKAGLSHLIAGGNPDFNWIQFEAGIDVSAMSVEQREPYIRKLMTFVEFEPRLKALSDNPKLLGLVRQLVGTEVKLIQDMALLKPAHVGREKPWHQDNAYFLHEPMDLLIGTWTALDEATIENGCMHVIPASHLGGPLPHYHDRDCQIADEQIAAEQVTAVPLKPGGVLLFATLLHHGTPPNRSAARRRAVQFHYASLTCRALTPEEHGKVFHDARGRAACAGGAWRKIDDRG